MSFERSSYSSARNPANQQPVPSNPIRTLVILFIVLVTMGGVALFTGATTVNLGLDLRGGTSVTLQPKVKPGEEGTITAEAIDQAVNIIRQRVDGVGVAESEVAAQGTGINRQIVISVPGENGRRIIDLVGQTAELRFRQVLIETGSGAGSSELDQASLPPGISPEVAEEFRTLDCSLAAERGGGVLDDPAEPVAVCDRDGFLKYLLAPSQVLGTDVRGAQAVFDATTALGWYVSLDFSSDGGRKFAQVTSEVVNLPSPQNQLAIVLDGLVVSAPRINETISGGQAQITGDFTQLEAQDLANVLKYGSLPLSFERGEVQQISPTLGAEQLDAGLLAGIIGLLLVLAYSLFYYRALGVVAAGSLLVAAFILIVAFMLLGDWIGYTLTLAGIAGAIVSIGVTADSFIVYFERLRDELREGRSLKTAVETAWIRARRTVIVSDVVSIIAAVLLYIFAVGGVRGFAFTLGISTLIDLIVIFFFSKPLVVVLSRMKFFQEGRRFSGLTPKNLGLKPAAERGARV
jgi:preprotein translocase subunit SecD